MPAEDSMHCDLAVEALFKLARLQKACSCTRQLAIPGLKSEHLALALKAGWLVKKPAPRYTSGGGGTGTQYFAITEAGRDHLNHLVEHSRVQSAWLLAAAGVV